MQNYIKTNTRLVFIQFIFSTFFSNKEVTDDTEDFQNYFYKLSVPSLDKDKEIILDFNKNFFTKLSSSYFEFINKNKNWLLEFETLNTGVNHLMGWETSKDTMSEVRLEFTTKEEAISYAKKNDIDFNIIEPKKSKIIKKSYADNFLK